MFKWSEEKLENQKVIKKRIEWVDIAKAITILLVIVGHTVDGLSRAVIYSFHMPLFFILSAYTFKCSQNNEQFVRKTEKAFKHLIIPMLCLFVFAAFDYVLRNFYLFISYDFIFIFIKNEILSLCFSSVMGVSLFKDHIGGIGLIWFLVVLFIGRTLFDYLHMKLSDIKLLIWCCVLSVFGVLIGKVQYLPLSFDIALAIMPLFYIGLKLNALKIEKETVRTMFVAWILFLICFSVSYYLTNDYLDIGIRHYTLYPLCFLIAFLGIIIISEFSVIIDGFSKIKFPLLYLGKNSMRMLCIHEVDSRTLSKCWDLFDNVWINVVSRITFDLFIFILVSFLFEIVKRNSLKFKIKKEVQP